jgi:hypothetical protein
MYPRYKFKITEVKVGWVEVAAPDKETAKTNVLAGGFMSRGQLLSKYITTVTKLEEV